MRCGRRMSALAAKLQLLRIDGRALAVRVPGSALLQGLRLQEHRWASARPAHRSSSGGATEEGVQGVAEPPLVGAAQEEALPTTAIGQASGRRGGGRRAGSTAASAPPNSTPASPTHARTHALQVMAAQANFVRVKVDALVAPGGADASGAALPPPPRARLLCVVRALLKKIKQEVLVGDRVRLVGIDWADGRGEAGRQAGRQHAVVGHVGQRRAPWRCSRTPTTAATARARAPLPPHTHPQAWWKRCCRAAAGWSSRRWQT